MSKQLESQRFVYKIHSSRLKKNKWKLVLPLDEARKNDEVISLASSQILRWIDELNEVVDGDAKAREIKSKIKGLRKDANSIQNKREIKRLYEELDKLQYKPDYLCLIIDSASDYRRACKGFSINGISYKRLLGTTGGIKNSTIVFISERLHGEISRRVENGRNPNIEFTPAKLEAYKALSCSASVPVSMPNGVLVVKDLSTEFESDVIYLSNEGDGEPDMSEVVRDKVKIDCCDGCGMMLPSLAERWSSELGLNYVTSGVNTRFPFEKGMVFTFDFVDFADKVSGNYIVKDAWGNDVDIRNVELVLTTSMVKLWSSYPSCDEYIRNALENKYTFGITKTCPEVLENERNLNYQFIQSYDLSDDDIDELIAPTMNEIKDVLGGDWRKAVLFLKGNGLSEKNINRLDNDYIKALMIDHRLIDDPYIQSGIYQLIRNRINEAKVGVVKVHGNYSIVSGDLYALCQHIFGLDVTGILKAGEIYNGYWTNTDADKLVCFRAPMTCHNNIRKVVTSKDDNVRYWYRYMNACTVFNAWDTAMIALNGMDYDGDLVMLTDNKVLVEKHRELPALMCGQRKAATMVPTEEDFIRSNLESFGNDIGQTTNWITSMFEVKSHFPKNSSQYEILEYRIKCGQQAQQDCIDRAKGIVCKAMTRSWHDRRAANKMESESERALYREIVADKKPYFMIYIYPALMKEYTTYIKNTDRNALREFQLSVSELMSTPFSQINERQEEFLRYYKYRMPVGTGDCVMNKICRKFEEEFDGYIGKHNSSVSFDYTIMRNDTEYTRYQYDLIKKLYASYNKQLQSYAVFSDYERLDSSDSKNELAIMNSEFLKECTEICSNKDVLCNIILDLCYSKTSTRKFAWSMCGDEIISNLLSKNNNTISLPTLNKDGDIKYCGENFSIIDVKIGDSE